MKNNQACYNFVFIEKYIAGLKLLGHEVKAIKNKHANLNNSFCKVLKQEIFIVNFYIKPLSTFKIKNNHSTNRQRKILLLLKKKEIRQISAAVQKFDLNIIPEKILINKKGLIKLVIHLAKSKNKYDKRELIKKKEVERLSNLKFI
ncbi:SsrA-binding protein [Candidatus Karelsulcia muelleri]